MFLLQGQEQVDLNKLRADQYLVEAVVANDSPMVHKRVSDLQLRARYKAAIVAVHRHGTRLHRYGTRYAQGCLTKSHLYAIFIVYYLNSAIGDIALEAGDCLLLVADGSEFVSKHRNNSTFALVSKVTRDFASQCGAIHC